MRLVLIILILAPSLSGCESASLQRVDAATTNPVAWQTSTVSLTASDFWIVADGQRFSGTAAGIDVHSDPGYGAYTTLELIWTEKDREMRFFTYFSADPSGWWSSEIRTYNGQTGLADWLYYRGTFFKAPIGTSFQGDLDLTNVPADPYRGELHLRGLVLSTTLSGS
jgi:hypothetical protein